MEQTAHTPQQTTSAAVTILTAVLSAIREAGAVPAGHLYAILSTQGCNIQQFDRLIGTLQGTGLVKKVNNLLYWIEPAK